MSNAASRRTRLVGLGILISVVLAAGGIAAWQRLFPSRADSTLPPADSPRSDDPRLTFDTPYRNVRPEVKYVGDAACAECHHDIAKQYARQPMGRSMGLSADQLNTLALGPQAHNPFEKFGNVYSVVVRDGKLYHREERRDASGKTVVGTECEARYVVGSGTRGKSFLVDRGGRLFMSPISWYGEKKIWDISPNYSEERRFNRPINAKCLYCHCNQANQVDGTQNTYKEPAFSGLTIGCERCHGPGELHVNLRESGEKPDQDDYTIVNPAKLEPRLRDAVCEQCHLQGQHRGLRRGRGAFDFRPGLPLDQFWSIHVLVPELMQSYRSVGQFEQMQLSRCYISSNGKLGCISCHNSHHRPDENERVEFYRSRCLQCHESHGCKMDAAQRKLKQPNDSCIECHMSKDGSSNIPHTAVTDHRILRIPESSQPKRERPLDPGQLPIRNYHEGAPGFSRAEADRDLGVALCDSSLQHPGRAAQLSVIAEPLLRQATRDHPDDDLAWYSLGAVLDSQRRSSEALEAFNRCLQLKPNREDALEFSANLATRMGRTETAIDFLKRLIEVNPSLAKHHEHLANLYAERREFTQSRTEFEAALKLDPVNTEARTGLIACLLRSGQNEQAKANFDILMALKPSNATELRDWYQRQTGQLLRRKE